MVSQLFVVLLLPTAAGMWVRHRRTAWVVGASLLGQTEFVLFAAAFFLIQVPLMLVAIAFQRLRGSD